MTSVSRSEAPAAPPVLSVYSAAMIEALFPPFDDGLLNNNADDGDGVGEVFVLVHDNNNVNTNDNNNTAHKSTDGQNTRRLVIGPLAHLEKLRKFQNNLTLNDVDDNINDDNDDDDERERFLYHVPAVHVTLSLGSGNDQPTRTQPRKRTRTGHESVLMQVFITTKRVFFVQHDADNENDTSQCGSMDFDFAMDARCISLHALTSEPTKSVYCQLSDDMTVTGNRVGIDSTTENDEDDDDDENNDNDNLPETREITIEPASASVPVPIVGKNKNDGNTNADNDDDTCQALFRALSKLINLNPDEENEDDGYGMSSGGGLGAMLGLMASAYGNGNDNDDDIDMMARIDPSNICSNGENEGGGEGGGGGGASVEQRDAMLARLDDMLVVPPHLEQHCNGNGNISGNISGNGYRYDGQFDDAEEDNVAVEGQFDDAELEGENGDGDGDEEDIFELDENDRSIL